MNNKNEDHFGTMGAEMSAAGVTVPDMDTAAILYSVELEAPGLRETARRILDAEARRFSVSLDVGDVLLRRAEYLPEPHITAALRSSWCTRWARRRPCSAMAAWS